MLTATRIRLYPTDTQEKALSVQFGCARWVWNNALAATGELYRATGKGLTYHAMAMRLPKLKQEFEWLKGADSQVLQQSLQNLARAFENFFAKRGKYPRFKKWDGKQSAQYPQRVKIEGSRIRLPKVGDVKCVVHREIVGNIKTITISKNSCGQYHAAILTDDGVDMPAVSTEGAAIGIDLGLTHFAITSSGSKFSNPKFLQKMETNLKRKQRMLARKTKGSNSRKKAKQLLTRVHERVSCARKDYLHKLSRRIVNENQVIAVEDLHVKGIMKNHCLARAVGDAGWSMFTGFLKYKSERAGKAFVSCDRWFPSSKTCSSCGAVCGKMPLDVRSWTCAKCGVHHCRDINAAKNIRAEGLRILAGGTPASASGGCIRPKVRSNSRRKAAPDEARSLVL
jgi:putative transposase